MRATIIVLSLLILLLLAQTISLGQRVQELQLDRSEMQDQMFNMARYIEKHIEPE